MGILRHFPFSSSTTTLQALTYLLGISLFSISFLVFLNSSVSFVITDLIGEKHGVGDIVGTLGFVDELVALVACPVWGLVSDRLGVRHVAVIGYSIIALSLFVFVQATNVYPQLLLARILFAIGATATATMVTAILPSLTDDSPPPPEAPSNHPLNKSRNPRYSLALSMESQLTITPERYARSHSTIGTSNGDAAEADAGSGKPSALAGLVGLFTGCGALVALILFLPLPASFSHIDGVTLGQAVSYAFYVVGVVSLLVAVFVFFGLRNLRGEEGKGWRLLLGIRAPESSAPATDRRASIGASSIREDAQKVRYVPTCMLPFYTLSKSGMTNFLPLPLRQKVVPYWHLLRDSVLLGFSDSQIGLGYLGGFVARASTVAISLFVPLFVNAFFIRNGYCQGSPNDPSPELKKECRTAYVLASVLTGVAQLAALLCAPLFGYFSRRRAAVNVPLVVSTALGIVGYVAFPRLPSPEFRDVDGRGGSPAVFLLAVLIGVSQIGAIVCSLGSLGKGVLAADLPKVRRSRRDHHHGEEAERLLDDADGDDHLVEDDDDDDDEPGAVATASRVRLKGSIAGVYSWCGGAAILLLTKLGGYLFDAVSTGAPFYMMAVFNGVLLVAALGVDASRVFRREMRK
ncbi:uncharacterized protein E0L32_005749 [Thyridium curvatum]|uniref:MFS transporter n=1 Tax=Thyridium curvatum TaxID=1093900 RepID=A0A507ASM2_9PEZI|nr:uncharacterized protein E0L32_005749 [Thyridium curvatum]TPX13805.1 hypothetical protein E0L32_005749 [Thyridium curvatum]